MSGFYLNTPDSPSDDSLSHRTSNISDDDDLDNLPYPTPLPRSAFLTPQFNASTYLSTLHNRHQTLSDLRAELRTRSQTLAKELLDLVNNEYQAFLALGSHLQGGEEKVEEVRVGVLGFVKGVGGVKEAVVARKEVVAGLVKEREKIRSEKEFALNLVEIHTRIGELEEALAVTSNGATEEDSSDEESDDDDEAEDEGGQTVLGVGRLERLVHSHLSIIQLIEATDPTHPFLVKQEERLMRTKNTLLLDLATSLRQAKTIGLPAKSKLLRLVSLYGAMDEAKEAIKVLRDTSTK
ncbi:Conserved oligomeric Golgi complex subunit 2 [Venturia nashicola]|nr:Conserved oligomeric Golgi complex subunit 2 [Venturia nashicola]